MQTTLAWDHHHSSLSTKWILVQESICKCFSAWDPRKLKSKFYRQTFRKVSPTLPLHYCLNLTMAASQHKETSISIVSLKSLSSCCYKLRILLHLRWSHSKQWETHAFPSPDQHLHQCDWRRIRSSWKSEIFLDLRLQKQPAFCSRQGGSLAKTPYLSSSCLICIFC